MKHSAALPNLVPTALAAVLIIVGAAVYLQTHPAPASFAPIPYPEVITSPAVVLSGQTATPSAQITSPVTPDTTTPPVTTLSIGETALRILKSLTGEEDLNDLLSSDLTSTYSSDEIRHALQSGWAQYGPVVSLWTMGDPNVTGDYADQAVEVTTSSGKYRYQVFMKREQGVWKLMGTEPLP